MGNTTTSMKKYQNLIVPVVAIVIGLVVLGLVIVPQGLKIPETNKQIDEVRKNINALNLKIGQLNGINLNQYKDDLNSSLVALPEEKDIPGAMTLVFNLLKNNGLTLNGISFGSEAPAATTSLFTIKVDVTGSKDSLTSFINQLKESPRVIKVDTLATSATASDTSMQILIGLNTFFQPIPKTQELAIDKPVELPTQQNKDTLTTIKDYQARNGNLIIEATASGVQLGKPDPFQ